MKCLACSGVSPEGSRVCQYCGSKDFAGQIPSASASSSVSADAPVLQSAPATAAAEAVYVGQAKTDNPSQSIPRIKALPPNGFRWLPFFFSVSYLSGYGNMKEANRTIRILLSGFIVAWIFVFIGQRELAGLVVIATFIFQIYYCFLVATRVDALVKRDMGFNWPTAIGYAFLYAILSAILTNRL